MTLLEARTLAKATALAVSGSALGTALFYSLPNLYNANANRYGPGKMAQQYRALAWAYAEVCGWTDAC